MKTCPMCDEQEGATRERDEAREAARVLAWLPRGCQAKIDAKEWVRRYPWLAEEGVDTPPETR